MLGLTAESGDYILIGNSLVYIEKSREEKIRVIVDSPKDVTIIRMDLLERMLAANGYTLVGYNERSIRQYRKYSVKETGVVVNAIMDFNEAIKEILALPPGENKFDIRIRK